MIVLIVLNFLLAMFLGYIIGRWSDNYLNVWLIDFNKRLQWLPHHWIYALIIMVVGIFYFKNNFMPGLWIFCFGAGLFISDLEDFLNLKFFAPTVKTKKTRRFWHID